MANSKTIIGSNRPSSFNWNAKTGRYYHRDSGRFIGRVELRNALDEIVDKSIVRTRSLSQELMNMGINLADWQSSMAEEIKNLHTVFGAAAHGGWDNLAAADYDRISGRIAEQFKYLQKFAEQIYTGEQRMDGNLPVRATLYAEAARKTFEAERRIVAEDAGFTQEQNVLGIADHCDDCMEETAAGWAEIGTLIPVGDRQCGARCRCILIYRKGPSDELGSDVYS